MKKNKGFTLVELLAVIVVLGIIMAIATKSLLKTKKEANISEAKQMEKMIADLGPDYYISKKSTGDISLDDLQDYGLEVTAGGGLKNPKGGEECKGYLKITRNPNSGPKFKGYICCPGLYQTEPDEVPTNCSYYERD